MWSWSKMGSYALVLRRTSRAASAHAGRSSHSARTPLGESLTRCDPCFRTRLCSSVSFTFATQWADHMKLSAALAVLSELKTCLQLGFVPTLHAVLRSPTLLFRPRAISRIFMNHVWSAYGDGVDTNSRSVKEGLITANAQGVVLDVGAGTQRLSVNGTSYPE